jgi:uncharacterized protein YecT (DUF1311 family)
MTITALVVMSVLGAAPTDRDSDAIDCEKPKTQLAINQCAGIKAANANARLNDVYRRYRVRLRTEEKRKLTEVQRRWLAFRASWREFVASGVEGGSAHPYVVSDCFTKMTEQRIKELDRVISCGEGDLACPSPRP